MCGEKFIRNAELPLYTGSPPRVRGKDTRHCDNRITNRITPACAGKRLQRCGARAECEDHPRVCGEKALTASIEVGDTGSPPRVRGKGKPPCRLSARQRITPACAGKRLKRSLLIPQKQHFHLFFVRFHLTSHTA